jgi:hypothetical protein
MPLLIILIHIMEGNILKAICIRVTCSQSDYYCCWSWASHLLGRHSNTWTTLPVLLWCWVFLKQGLANCLPRLASSSEPHDLCLLYHRCEPPAPGCSQSFGLCDQISFSFYVEVSSSWLFLDYFLNSCKVVRTLG